VKILIEGERYQLDILEDIISDKFYKIIGSDGVINHVGYFYSFKNREVVYILPKVFMGEDGIVLFNWKKDELLDKKIEYSKLGYFAILFYRSLIKYRKREINTVLVQKNESLVLDSNIGENEYSFLDIILNIINFHRENATILLFIEKKYKAQQHKKVSWSKTLRKTLPIFNNGKPIYSQAYNRKKYIDSEEKLLTIFYSVLHNINSEYNFNIQIDKIYTIYRGKEYRQLCKKASKILKSIKYKYFSDTLKRVYRLMELYFNIGNHTKSNKRRNEFILVDKYHIIFEDMIDNLFSDSLPTNLKRLKYQDDGKEVDHIFEYSGLLDDEESIYYIGDSKYYKTGTNIGRNSIYKQFTYAKNIIQFNIDILNQGNIEKSSKIKYRDELTEGYNITPNFFIQGVISDYNHTDDRLKLLDKNPRKLSHFPNRLFDRDTLIIHYYSINFLYVLKSYILYNNQKIEIFKKKSRVKFKNTLVNYLNENYDFYEKDFAQNTLSDAYQIYGKTIVSTNTIENFVNSHFKLYIGKMYRKEREPMKLIIANEKGFDVIRDFDKFFL
jgi:hypothetical protein